MRVLLAIDVDDASHTGLLEQAERWVHRLGATIDLLHVEGGKYGFGYVSDPEARRVLDVEAGRMRQRDQAALDNLLAAMNPAVRGIGRIAEGQPVDEILDACAHYDVLIIGTHGRTGMAQLWLGSVAERVVRKAPIPVLVLRLPRD